VEEREGLSPTPELFHAIADPACAAMRRLVVELGLAGRVRFRNLAYPEVQSDFLMRGGTAVPALFEGGVLHHGLAVEDRLRRMAASCT
jgi:hypothetical protein